MVITRPSENSVSHFIGEMSAGEKKKNKTKQHNLVKSPGKLSMRNILQTLRYLPVEESLPMECS